jgi:hypothetical protein
MTSLDPDRAWTLFMSDPAYFAFIFVTVAVAVFGLAWWLRHFIGKERIATLEARIATLEERLRLSSDKYDISTTEIQRVTAYASRLEGDVAKLKAALDHLPSPGLRPQVDALAASAALVANSVNSLSTANNELGVALTTETARPEIGRAGALKITIP